jgi:hypothetical protein
VFIDLFRERGGSKVSLEFCFKRMQQRGIDTDALWANIVDVVCKSLYCVQDVIPWHPAAFELFGYDVLIDADLKPWLIEVNSSPSLARDNPLDYEIKDALLRDVLAVVDAPAVDRSALSDVLQRRLSDRKRLSNVADAKSAAAAGAIKNQNPFFSAAFPHNPPPPLPLLQICCAFFEAVCLEGGSRLHVCFIAPLATGKKHSFRYGEAPRELGGFQPIAPGKAWDAVVRAHKGGGGR